MTGAQCPRGKIAWGGAAHIKNFSLILKAMGIMFSAESDMITFES